MWWLIFLCWVLSCLAELVKPWCYPWVSLYYPRRSSPQLIHFQRLPWLTEINLLADKTWIALTSSLFRFLIYRRNNGNYFLDLEFREQKGENKERRRLTLGPFRELSCSSDWNILSLIAEPQSCSLKICLSTKKQTEKARQMVTLLTQG
jgi:hypothetical protein